MRDCISVLIFFVILLRPIFVSAQDITEERAAILQAVSFLKSSQLPEGNFPTLICDDPALARCLKDSSVFGTTFAVNSLELAGHITGHDITDPAARRGLDFLLSQKEPGVSFWRYWSKDSISYHMVSPDLDDTSCVSALLVKQKISFSPNIEEILGYQRSNGIFPTWTKSVVSESGKISIDKDEPPDCGVNANVLYYLSLSGRPVPGLCNYLDGIVLNDSFPGCSFYYDNKYVFYYLIARAYAEGKAQCLKPAMEKIISELSSARLNAISPLNSALAAIILIDADRCGNQVDSLIEGLVLSRKKDGSWGREPFYADKIRDVFFGSEAISTAMALEALSKHAILCRSKNN